MLRRSATRTRAWPITRAACHFFAWVEQHEIGALADIEPIHVAAYIEVLQTTAAKPTVKLHLAALVVVFVYALAENLQVMHRWLERPYLFIFPAIGIIAALVAASSVRRRRDGLPFYMVALIFVAAFGTLAISFWPYMIPFSITIAEGAAPHSSLAFMFWGEGLFVFPLMLLYTVISYTVFRGKVRSSERHY